MNAAATANILKEFGLQKGAKIKISELFQKLKSNKKADHKFIKMWTLFAASSVIAPTLGTTVSPRLYQTVINANEIGDFNWCELVVRILKASKQPSGKNNILKPCQLFLMVNSFFSN